MGQTTTAKVRLEAGKAARFSASAQSTDWFHAVRDLPLPAPGEGAIVRLTTTPNPGNVGYYGELFDRLGFETPPLIGHSFGGMLACEIAAAMPERISRLVLIDPLGLWRDDLPVKNWMILPEDQRRATLFADPVGTAAERFFALPADQAARVEAQAGLIWSQACTRKFVWPIPDKGLKRRIHRIAAPTLIIWGAADQVIAPAYAHEFAGRIASARVELIDHAGHLPHLEQAHQVARLVRDFLAG
jgi:pimeloyl-ACP methyl ester carboxylesterase